jgi:hypothetical protein
MAMTTYMLRQPRGDASTAPERANSPSTSEVLGLIVLGECRLGIRIWCSLSSWIVLK